MLSPRINNPHMDYFYVFFISLFSLIVRNKYLQINSIFPLRYSLIHKCLPCLVEKNWRKRHINLQKYLLPWGSILPSIRMCNSWTSYTTNMRNKNKFWFILWHFQSCLAFALKDHLIKMVSNLGALIII